MAHREAVRGVHAINLTTYRRKEAISSALEDIAAVEDRGSEGPLRHALGVALAAVKSAGGGLRQ